ncbi:hypothetical protein Y590_00625 [Methylobacterium sp. AMS5]|nr:hypothetical protein Y590_00625 [Methylobacterium sp. AMS5]
MLMPQSRATGPAVIGPMPIWIARSGPWAVPHEPDAFVRQSQIPLRGWEGLGL